jgi:hypothetical protein
MGKKLTQCVWGQKRGDARRAQGNFLSGGGDALSEFVVVGKIIDQRLESADRFEVMAAKRQG